MERYERLLAKPAFEFPGHHCGHREKIHRPRGIHAGQDKFTTNIWGMVDVSFAVSTRFRYPAATLAASLFIALSPFAFAGELGEMTTPVTIDADLRRPLAFDPSKSADLKEVRELRKILSQPDEQIDLGKAKLTIDRMIDPTVDVEANLRKIEAMVAEVKAMPDFGDSKTDHLNAVRRSIYEPGAWNANQPYRYDLDDPLGGNLRNKLLPNYLASKKGNCVTMPFLFIILGQRLGLEVTAATAPAHIFVKAKHEASGHWFNIEATDQALPVRDAFYRERSPMTDDALANGVYLRPLTKKETVALMAMTLAEHYLRQAEPEKLIAVVGLVLEYEPKNVSAMIMKANAYYDLIDKHYKRKYPSPDKIPDSEKGQYQYLVKNNALWSSKALALGWRELRPEDDEKYLQSIQEARRKTVN